MSRYNTRQRETLLEYLQEHPDQELTVRQIADDLLSRQISTSAVYRNLAVLEEERLVRRGSRPGSREAVYQYVGSENCRNHLHLTCIRCGKTVHLRRGATELLISLAVREGYELDLSRTVLYGVCQDCQALEARS